MFLNLLGPTYSYEVSNMWPMSLFTRKINIFDIFLMTYIKIIICLIIENIMDLVG